MENSTILFTFLFISTMMSISLGFPFSGKSSQLKYKKVEDPTLTFLKKELFLFPVKSKILCPDLNKCKENQENGIRVKKQLNFEDESRLLSDHQHVSKDNQGLEEEPQDYEDLLAAESGVGRWKRSLLGRLFGYPQGHYRRRWWPARRHNHHHHHRHHYNDYDK